MADRRYTDSRRTAGKFYSGLGWRCLIGTLVAIVVQLGVGRLVSLIGMLCGQAATFSPDWTLTLEMIPMYAISMPLMALIVATASPVEDICGHGVPRRRMSAGQMLAAGAVAYAIVYVGNIAGTLVTTVISAARGIEIANVPESVLDGASPWLVFLFTVIIAPVMEELIFRKILIDRAVRYGEGIAILLSGLTFGLFHGNFSQFMYAFPLGMFLAFIYVRTGRMRYTVGLHAFINLVGGVVSIYMLRLIESSGMQDFLAAIESTLESGGSTSDIAAAMQPVAGSLVILGIYALFMFMVILTGIVIMIARHRRFVTFPGPLSVRGGASVAVFNVGMVLYILFWGTTIVYGLIHTGYY